MNFEFWIPVLVSLFAVGWNFFQQRNISVLKGRLDEKSLIHRFQFEKEFAIYSDLWIALVDLRNVTHSLRPFLSYKSEGITDDENLKNRFKQFNAASDEVIRIFEHNRPFYSNKVYEKVDKVLRNAHFELIDFEYHGHGDMEQRNLREKRIDDIMSSMEEVNVEIRKRIHFLEERD